MEKRVPIKHVNLNEIAAKYIQGKLLCPPLIYSVHGNDQTILVSCETGHVFSLNLKEPKKVLIYFSNIYFVAEIYYRWTFRESYEIVFF